MWPNAQETVYYFGQPQKYCNDKKTFFEKTSNFVCIVKGLLNAVKTCKLVKELPRGVQKFYQLLVWKDFYGRFLWIWLIL